MGEIEQMFMQSSTFFKSANLKNPATQMLFQADKLYSEKLLKILVVDVKKLIKLYIVIFISR